VSLWPDADSVIRRINYAMTDSQIVEKMSGREPGPATSWETIYESLDGRSLRKLGFNSRIPPAGLSAMIRFGPNDAYQPRSLFEIFVPAYWANNYGNGSFFKDKVVLVGAALPLLTTSILRQLAKRPRGRLSISMPWRRRSTRSF
jgi:CHASE2 domain.